MVPGNRVSAENVCTSVQVLALSRFKDSVYGAAVVPLPARVRVALVALVTSLPITASTSAGGAGGAEQPHALPFHTHDSPDTQPVVDRLTVVLVTLMGELPV